MSAGEWRLVLPMTLPLSLNDRTHFRVKAQAVKEVRDMVIVLARAAKIPPCRKVRTTLIYVPRDRRRRDPLNLVATMKACEDGLVDAGVIPDDNPDYVESCMPLIDLPQPDLTGGRLTLFVERVL